MQKTSGRVMGKRIIFLGLGLLLGVGMTNAPAATRTWLTPSGGLFNTPTNWSDDSVPIAGDDVLFNQGGNYTVTFQNSVTNRFLYLDDDTVTFDLDSQTYVLTTIRVGRNNGTGTAIFTNGTLTSGASLLGVAADDDGTMVLRGVTWTASAAIRMGNVGPGDLRIEEGSKVTAAGIRLGYESTAVGGNSLLVTGQGTELTTTAMATMNYADSTVLVSSGATWNIQDIFILAQQVGSQGDFVVDNAGLRQTGTGYFYIGQMGSGTMTFQNGATLTNTSPGLVALGLGAGSQGTLTLASGSQFIHDTVMEVARDATATGTVNVSASRLEAGTLAIGGLVGVARGSGSLTVADQGSVGVASNLIIWGTGTLAVDHGTITTQTLDLKADSKLNVTLHAAQANGGAMITTTDNAVITDAVFQVDLATGYSPAPGSVFTLLQVDGDLTGTFAGIADGDTVWTDPEDPELYMVLNYNLNNDSVTLTVIPEPGSLLLLGLAGGLLLAIRRRSS